MTKREYKAWLALIVICILYAMTTSCDVGRQDHEKGLLAAELFKDCMQMASIPDANNDVMNMSYLVSQCHKISWEQANRIGTPTENAGVQQW